MNSTVPGDFTDGERLRLRRNRRDLPSSGQQCCHGTPQTFSVVQNDQRLDVSAVLEPSIPPTNTPSNAFNLGAVQRNKKKELRR